MWVDMTTLKTPKSLSEALCKLGCALLDFSLSIFATIFSGYVLSLLWGFFIVVTFGVAALNIPSAIGMMIVVGYATKQMSYAQYVESSTEESVKFRRWMQFVKPAMALVIGWVVKYFI